MSNCLAIIPARGGSKRIPGKNIKNFLGKPIIAYSIETALQSKLFNEVMVSTDSDEIAEIAKQYGAKVPFMRSSKNSDDHASTMDALKEVLDVYKATENKTFEYACCIYPTAPLIQSIKLEEGFKKITGKESFNSVFPIVAFGYPVLRGLEIDTNGLTKMVWPEYIHTRSQDLKPIFHDAGQWYWFKPKCISSSLFTEKTASVILREEEVQDIDNMVDWKLAEMKYKLLKNIA